MRSALLPTFLLAFLSACNPIQTKPEFTCVGFDWFEAGRVDGASGIPLSRISEHQARCDRTSTPMDVELYVNGRNAGLIDYCTPISGLEMGKTNQPYEGVCPEHLERSFLASYELGKKIRRLEAEKADLKARIEVKFDRGSVDQLQKRRARIDAEINKLEHQGTSDRDKKSL